LVVYLFAANEMSDSKYEIVVNFLWKMAEEDDYIDLISQKATSTI